jgi:hypothetical protein
MLEQRLEVLRVSRMAAHTNLREVPEPVVDAREFTAGVMAA